MAHGPSPSTRGLGARRRRGSKRGSLADGGGLKAHPSCAAVLRWQTAAALMVAHCNGGVRSFWRHGNEEKERPFRNQLCTLVGRRVTWHAVGHPPFASCSGGLAGQSRPPEQLLCEERGVCVNSFEMCQNCKKIATRARSIRWQGNSAERQVQTEFGCNSYNCVQLKRNCTVVIQSVVCASHEPHHVHE